MPEVLRVGIAGLGEAATEFLPAYAADPRVKLTEAADTRQRARERFAHDFHARTYETVEELCQSPDVDVVYVATPHELHAEHVMTAVKNRKHVIVEKPMALTVEDCEAMNTAADEYGVKILCGHNHSYDAPIVAMRHIIKSGELGRLRMINAWNYNDFMVRPYPDFALEMSRGVVLNQGPHQVDMVRLLGGGMVRSVRAMAGRWDESRPGEGSYLCFLEFEDGVAASLVFNGYGFFDTAEFNWWIGEGGAPRYPDKHVMSRRNYLGLTQAERANMLEGLKEKMRYGSVGLNEHADMPAGWEKGGHKPAGQTPSRAQPRFELIMVSCDKGDMRQSQNGILVYNEEKREIAVDLGTSPRQVEIDELYASLVEGRPTAHDGRWGEATMEVCLAILQ